MLKFMRKFEGLLLCASLIWPLFTAPGSAVAADTTTEPPPQQTQPSNNADIREAISPNNLVAEEELAKTLPPGLAIWLNDGKDKFLAIFTADQSGQPKGGAIILHDADAHPDWPEVIRPLRTSLPLHGWATISIQLPRMESINSYTRYQPVIDARIQKAAEHLRSVGLNNIALIGHGTGALAATAFLANNDSDIGIRGFVGIGLNVIKTDNITEYLPSQLEKIKLPMLDIFGSRDLDQVTTTAPIRALAAKKSSVTASRDNQLDPYKKSGLSKTANNSVQGYIAYRQIEIEGSDHDFTGQGKILSKRVLGWLERHIKGTAITSATR